MSAELSVVLQERHAKRTAGIVLIGKSPQPSRQPSESGLIHYTVTVIGFDASGVERIKLIHVHTDRGITEIHELVDYSRINFAIEEIRFRYV